MNSDKAPVLLKKAAALGFRAHSGWATLVALAAPVEAPVLVRRCRIELADSGISGSMQPYHAAGMMELSDAEAYLRRCCARSAAMAKQAVHDSLMALSEYEVKCACILLASGKPLPGLSEILASHTLIHTAEGEFYRVTLRDACDSCGVPTVGIKERELSGVATQALGKPVAAVQRSIATFGKVAGAPWRQDEKLSALAAWVVLKDCTSTMSGAHSREGGV
jgi:hypothetical protein